VHITGIGSISQNARRVSIVGALVVAGALALSACASPAAARTASQSLAAGIVAQRAGDYGLAITDYQQVLTSEPHDVYALYDLGDSEQFLGRLAAAKANYTKVLALSPNFVNALYNLAIIDAKSNPGAAAPLFRQVLTLYPKDAPARWNLGKVLIKLGQRHLGNAQINLAIHEDPSLGS
jgi:tetratricopeptide (TPR) repeat protein